MTDPPARRTREETKQLVLEAAVDLVRRDGLGAEPTTITYQKVFDHLEETTGVRITRASVHERIWENQRSFQFDVILAANETATGVSEATAMIPGALDSTRDLNPVTRLAELTRVLVEAGTDALLQDDLYYSWTGMTLALSRDRTMRVDQRAALEAAVTTEYGRVLDELEEVIRNVAVTIGLRPRGDLFPPNIQPWRYIASITNAVSEGFAVAGRFDMESIPAIDLNSGPRGEARRWVPTAIGHWAVLNTLLEVDPEVHPDHAEEA